jgi:hypothetical protein
MRTQDNFSEVDLMNTREALIVYQGGGYDGCIYEWNWGWIDENGEFTSWFHSGSLGCKDLNQLKSKIRYATLRSDKFFVYESNLQDWVDFVDKFNPGIVIKVAKKLVSEHIILISSCNECKKEMPIHLMNNAEDFLVGPHCDGETYFICQNCIDQLERDSEG